MTSVNCSTLEHPQLNSAARCSMDQQSPPTTPPTTSIRRERSMNNPGFDARQPLEAHLQPGPVRVAQRAIVGTSVCQNTGYPKPSTLRCRLNGAAEEHRKGRRAHAHSRTVAWRDISQRRRHRPREFQRWLPAHEGTINAAAMQTRHLDAQR